MKPAITVNQLKAAISRCVDNAIKECPAYVGDDIVDVRARSFVARLSAHLEVLVDQELADKVFSILKRSDT